MNIAPIDLVFIVIIVACCIINSIRGFIDGLFGKGIPAVSIILGCVLCKAFAKLLSRGIKNETVCLIVSFFIIFVVVFLILKIIQTLLKKAFEGKIFKSLDKVLGLILGLVEGIAIVVVVIIALKSQTWFDVSGLVDNSWFVKVISNFVTLPTADIDGALDKASQKSSQIFKKNK